jgi:hypothetical protein
LFAVILKVIRRKKDTGLEFRMRLKLILLNTTENGNMSMGASSQSESLLPYNYHLLYSIKYDKLYREYLKELLRYIRKYKKVNISTDDLNTDYETRPREPAQIPLEVVREILLYLDHRSLIAASQICKNWQQIIDQGHYWNHLCLHDFNIHANSFHKLHPKELYKVSLKNYYDTKNYYINGLKGNIIKCQEQYFSTLLPSNQIPLISVAI